MAIPPFAVDQNYPETCRQEMETYVDWIAPTFVLSLTGLPVASVPCGLDPDGCRWSADRRQAVREEALLALASQVQQCHPIGRPPLLREATSRKLLIRDRPATRDSVTHQCTHNRDVLEN